MLSIDGCEKFSDLGWAIFEHIPQAAHTLSQDFFKMPSAVTPETLDGDGKQLKERLQASSAEETVLSKQHLPRTADNMVESYDRNFVSEMVKMQVRWENIPPENDFEAMRKWSKTEFHTYNRTPQCTPLRSPVDVATHDEEICYRDNDKFGIRVYIPQGKSEDLLPALVTYHGGGWVHGDARSDEELAVFFASNLRAVVFGVDYRLAPEHTIETIHEDCYEALNWVLEHRSTFHIDPGRVALWGCSAGGLLAATVAARDAQEHQPTRIQHVNLVVPATCHPDFFPSELAAAYTLKSRKVDSDDLYGPVLKHMERLYDLMAPSPLKFTNPIVSPLLLPEIPAHHAPTHITVAGCDFLRDQGISYALRMRDFGIETTLEVIPGVPHGFTWVVSSNATKQWTKSQVRIFDAAFHRGKRQFS